MLEDIEIARIEFESAFEIVQRFFLFALSPQNVACQFENMRVVRERSPRHLELRDSAIIIEEAAIQIFGAREMRFSSVGPKTESSLDRGLRQSPSLRCVFPEDEVELVVRVGELTLCEKERRIAGKRLIQQINCFH